MNPINPGHLTRSAVIRRAFFADEPLPRFAVLPNFVRRELIEHALAGCKRALFETFCGYSMTADGADVKSGFREPDENVYFVTIHKRSRAAIPEVVHLRESF